MDNESLCLAAQRGDTAARHLLAEQNIPFVKRETQKLLQRRGLANSGIDWEDLFQSGCVGLLEAIAGYSSKEGKRFLTYAGYWVRKRIGEDADKFMEVQKREQKQADEEEDAGERWQTGGLYPSPEQEMIRMETLWWLRRGLEQLTQRERQLLEYRFGFEDEQTHTRPETARHFHLRPARERAIEDLALDNVWLELPWWYR